MDPPVACSLEVGDASAQVDEWQRVLSRTVEREAIDGGIRLRFPPDDDVASEVARLAAAERACCQFFDFTVRLTAEATWLEARAPQDAQPVIAALFGPAA